MRDNIDGVLHALEAKYGSRVEMARGLGVNSAHITKLYDGHISPTLKRALLEAGIIEPSSQARWAARVPRDFANQLSSLVTVTNGQYLQLTYQLITEVLPQLVDAATYGEWEAVDDFVDDVSLIISKINGEWARIEGE